MGRRNSRREAQQVEAIVAVTHRVVWGVLVAALAVVVAMMVAMCFTLL